MASDDHVFDDDFLAELVAKDANDFSLKYSAMGMDDSTSKRPANAPKLNKRFLHNIIKDTKNHNAAILAKERAESQARLREMEVEEEKKRLKTRPRPADIRKRQLGDINAILGPKSRRSEESDSRKSRRRKEDEDAASGSRRRKERGDDDDRRRSNSQKIKRHDTDGDDRERRRERRRDSSRHRSRSRSPSRKERKHTHRSRSPSHRSSRHSRHDDRGSHRHDRSEKEKHGSNRRGDLDPTSESSSDPLDDIIGPAPPPKSLVQARGRGTTSAYSGIDRRFSESYDPSMDVEPEDTGEGDWSDTVEAYRDRLKLQQNRERRLRAAGFSDEYIAEFKADGSEKKEASVKWAKKGEKREWDIGKEDTDGDL